MSPVVDRAGTMRQPTARQLEVAAAVIRCGSHAEAAAALGLREQTVRNQISRLIRTTGSTTGFYGVLVILGWLRSPDVS